MRRENRRKSKSENMIYITVGALVLAIVTFIITFIAYSNKLDGELYSLDSDYLEQYTNLNNDDNEITTASSSIGKKVEESSSNSATNIVSNSNNNIKKENIQIIKNDVTINKNVSKVEKDPTFVIPIDGEIIKEFAEDSLIYSETLKEWTTHLGVDISAERATVVKAAAEGTIEYIKNDPRYGLTIIIKHSNGFRTLYANLLTTDFVSEGEKVEAGQTIGTIGDSSVYEIVDNSHLHFEITKDGKYLNPMDYIKK